MDATSPRRDTSQFPDLLRRFAAQMADHQRTQLARRLLEAREAQSLSREDLAYKSGVNVKTIKRIEHKEHDPRPSTVRRLAKGLGLSPETLRPDPALELERLGRLEEKVDQIQESADELVGAVALLLAGEGDADAARQFEQAAEQRRERFREVTGND